MALDPAGDITLRADVRSGSGAISVLAGGHLNLLDGADVLTGFEGSIDLVAGSGSIALSTASALLSGSGDIALQAAGTIAPASAQTTGTITLQPQSGLSLDPLDRAPIVRSGGTASLIDENSGANQVVYTAHSGDIADLRAVTRYSLKDGSDSALTINASTGAVTLIANPNFEAQPSYSFTVVATDSAGNAGEQAVRLAIHNLDELAPQISSGTTAVAKVRPGGAVQQVYRASAVDVGDDSLGIIRFSLKPGSDPALQIDEVTGDLVLIEQPQRRPYAFTLVATDAAGNRSEQRCELRIKMVGSGLLPYDAAREIEVISADNGSVSYVLQGDRVMLDATQLALAAQTFMASASAPVAPALAPQAEAPRDLVQWALSAPVSVGIAARIEALTAMASPEPSASAQMLATPEFLSMRSPAAEATPSSPPSSSPPATEPALVNPPANAGEPTSPVSPNAPAGPIAPSVRQQAPDSSQAPASDHAEQERSADAGAHADVAAATPVALRWGSVLADMFTRLKSLATGSRPAQAATPGAEATGLLPVQAPSQGGAAASTESTSNRGGDAAPGA